MTRCTTQLLNHILSINLFEKLSLCQIKKSIFMVDMVISTLVNNPIICTWYCVTYNKLQQLRKKTTDCFKQCQINLKASVAHVTGPH